MQGPVASITSDDLKFYQGVLYQRIQHSDVALSPGVEMMTTLHDELKQRKGEQTSDEYFSAVAEMYKTVTDSLMSAVHRSVPHAYIDRSAAAECHVTKDEEELLLMDGIIESEEEDGESDSGSDKANLKKNLSQKQHKRDEQRHRRKQEEELLLNERKVSDEKGKLYHTIGPFPEPRLTIRANTSTFPSRKALQHRTIVRTPTPSASSDDEAEELPSLGATSSEGEAADHLTTFLNPLSFDSLKKVSESAKAKIKSSSPQSKYVSQIVKTAVRLGCEKACVLMDKHKIIEEMTSHVQAGPLPTAASIDFLKSLPEPLKQGLGSVLGLSEEKPFKEEDMWERMVAMGFLSVLTNLRLKPLKKIAQELEINLPDSNSTEKFCEAIVYAAFPRERIRAKVSRCRRQKHIKFTVLPEKTTTKGDMGFISFKVHNISTLPRDPERHYSPEFQFAQLKWSLLCMANKESLALYLCQTGSVYCKFLITVVNHANHDDSICNEGTQSFSTLSQENDWGFNNVLKFSELLNLSQGFLDPNDDSITIEVGIVLVQPTKVTAAPKEKVTNKGKANVPRVDEAVVQELIADEHAEAMKKKTRQEINKMFREEEKLRKELSQRSSKAFHDISDRFKSERQRKQKELADKERREEAERQRDIDRLRQVQEQSADLKRRVEELKNEGATFATDKKKVTQEIKDLSKANDRATQELKSVTDKITALQQRAKQQEKRIAAARKRLEEAQRDEIPTPRASDDDQEMSNDDNEVMEKLRESLQQIVGN